MSQHYGCHNRPPFHRQRLVQDGWRFTSQGTSREPRMVPISAVMAPACQYTHTDLGRADARCEGCKHKALEASNLEATQGNACRTTSTQS